MDEVTPEMSEAWGNYVPVGQFNESMSFARFNGMLRAAFFAGWLACGSRSENDTGLTSFKDTLS